MTSGHVFVGSQVDSFDRVISRCRLPSQAVERHAAQGGGVTPGAQLAAAARSAAKSAPVAHASPDVATARPTALKFAPAEAERAEASPLQTAASHEGGALATPVHAAARDAEPPTARPETPVAQTLLATKRLAQGGGKHASPRPLPAAIAPIAVRPKSVPLKSMQLATTPTGGSVIYPEFIRAHLDKVRAQKAAARGSPEPAAARGAPRASAASVRVPQAGFGLADRGRSANAGLRAATGASIPALHAATVAGERSAAAASEGAFPLACKRCRRHAICLSNPSLRVRMTAECLQNAPPRAGACVAPAALAPVAAARAKPPVTIPVPLPDTQTAARPRAHEAQIAGPAQQDRPLCEAATALSPALPAARPSLFRGRARAQPAVVHPVPIVAMSDAEQARGFSVDDTPARIQERRRAEATAKNMRSGDWSLRHTSAEERSASPTRTMQRPSVVEAAALGGRKSLALGGGSTRRFSIEPERGRVQARAALFDSVRSRPLCFTHTPACTPHLHGISAAHTHLSAKAVRSHQRVEQVVSERCMYAGHECHGVQDRRRCRRAKE